MAAKGKNKRVENIALEGEISEYVGYSTYFCSQPLFSSLKISNGEMTDVEGVLVTVSGDTPLILPKEIPIDLLLSQSSVEVDVEDVLNPEYLADITEITPCNVSVRVSKGKDVLQSFTAGIFALPMNFWSGLSGNVELIAASVRPLLSDCAKIKAEAKIIKKEGGRVYDGGMPDGAAKSSVKESAQKIYTEIKRQSIERTAGAEKYTERVELGDISQVLSKKEASPMEMALFFASCLENAGLNPLILMGERAVAVGCWLYDSCFSLPVEDDMDLISRYAARGVNNISCVDVSDLFAHKNASFDLSEEHFLAGLAAKKYEQCVDVRRCRIDGVFPMPLKVKRGESYELLREAQTSFETRPGRIIDSSRFELTKKLSKEDNWKRSLLDLSLRNNLLSFKYKGDCLHVRCADIDSFVTGLDFVARFSILPELAFPQSTKVPDFGAAARVRKSAELIAMEMKDGKIRTFGEGKELLDRSSALIRRSKAAEEEAGSGTLYLAIGFLAWTMEGDDDTKYAPICLLPVDLKRVKQAIYLECDNEYEPNATLLEYLFQTFGIDLRGMVGKGLAPSEMIASVKSAVSDRKGWEIYDDVYVAQFMFSRFAMWKDIDANMDEYRKNSLIESLIMGENRFGAPSPERADEDRCDPKDILITLPSDSSQFEAVAEAVKGTTFVLHGPPGTGKSQTITNMIANAMEKGMSVLFVAEKQAAIKVVKKRLDGIGVGDFCLELHLPKSDKAEITRQIDSTLALTAEFDDEAFSSAAEKISGERGAVMAFMEALHKKRRIGVSVYDAIVLYFQNKNAPELVNVESTFYDSLTEKKVDECRELIYRAQTAAGECGGVYLSPFSGISLTSCDEGTKDCAVTYSEVLFANLKNYKNYLTLFLNKFGQKTSTFTRAKFDALKKLSGMLLSGELDVFFSLPEEKLNRFYNAARRYDDECRAWMSSMRSLPDIGELYREVDGELENWGENYRSSKVLLQVLKKINRCAKTPVAEKDEVELIRRAADMEKARRVMAETSELTPSFSGFGGSINEKKLKDFTEPLFRLHDLCADIFMDYNANSFSGACVRSKKYASLTPLISGLLAAGDALMKSVSDFDEFLGLDEKKISDEDILEYYGSKCTALLDNIDMLPSWCVYKRSAEELNALGLKFMTDAMESGVISGDEITSSFIKNVYRNFLRTNIPQDDVLSEFSAALLDENAARLTSLLDDFSKMSREKIRADLISRLPGEDAEGDIAAELIKYRRKIKGSEKTFRIRDLFSETPTLMKAVSPCVMMSPSTVSMYLPATSGFFDLVIFDEASQMPTAEAVASLARGKSAVIVGDPNQLPPTTFFSSGAPSEEYESEGDLESILADALALGITQRHLVWHYRSRHESLIAFSNIMYYGSRLCTFPSPDALESKVTLRYIESGIYDRGGRKVNTQEADAIVSDVISRLKSPEKRKQSIGIVTFSSPQQEYLEKRLSKAIYDNKLEDAAYDGDEPLFVKNLENVQGDERDIILFSVCYGPDRTGKLSYNFGPLNQYGGWRRLNVAVTRAREEMTVYSSMRYSMIDLSRTSARGVAGLRAFLEFAQKGRTNIAAKSDEVIVNRNGIGKYIAAELEAVGYECRCDVGVSDFKIDVAVIDPKNRTNFILAILSDGSEKFSTKDRVVMQVQTLKRANWNVIRLYSLSFYNNPKREIKKIKDFLDRITRGGSGSVTSGFKKPYRTAKIEPQQKDSAFILSDESDTEIIRVVKAIVSAEEPVSEAYLIRRTLSAFGVAKSGAKIDAKMKSLIDRCGFIKREILGCVYVMKQDRYGGYDRYRVEEKAPYARTAENDYTPYDIISLVKAVLLNNVSMYMDELCAACLRELKLTHRVDKFTAYITSCIELGIAEGVFIKSIADKISLV
ncbi:MAG: DUF3320 domain-containing protein [Clostridia bacterium]|nr:DUF3320 domain-containing protein [Clostridia bacterium]